VTGTLGICGTGSSEFDVLDGYWGDRAALVLDSCLAWVPDEWTQADDHDHCAICWAHIYVTENRDHFASSTGKRVCAACYDYVRSRSLDFITAAFRQADAADPRSDDR